MNLETILSFSDKFEISEVITNLQIILQILTSSIAMQFYSIIIKYCGNQYIFYNKTVLRVQNIAVLELKSFKLYIVT